jgi:hypothetical protein
VSTPPAPPPPETEVKPLVGLDDPEPPPPATTKKFTVPGTTRVKVLVPVDEKV